MSSGIGIRLPNFLGDGSGSGNIDSNFLGFSVSQISYEEARDQEVDHVEKFGRYVRYNEVLGKGAFKTVAFDQVDGIEVAWNRIKIDDVSRSPKDLEKLDYEVYLLREMNHENIIKLYDSWFDEQKRTINMITELFTSGSLRQYRKKHQTVDMKAIKNWARQILRGLEYLHSQNPPIIHRDLKCDNIFVNGNHGEVKIGDLGLATIMHQPTAKTVIGTPEFMAPELYEEEYDELVDIYSFGLCLLEMVTLEYPYSECKNSAQIFRKVTKGVKPASLGQVASTEVKELIEKCLAPASQRLSANELLKDPFLQFEHSKVCAHYALPTLNKAPKFPSSSNHGPHSMDIDHEHNQSVCTCSNYGSSCSSVLEIQRLHQNKEFKLKGTKNDDRSISLTLRIADRGGSARNINFLFYLDSDTASAVAAEMVEQLELADHDVAFIADFIDYLIIRILPGWKPSYDCLSSGNTSASGTLMTDQWATPLAASPADLVVKQEDAHQFHMDPLPPNFASPIAAFILSSFLTTTGNELSHGSATSEIIGEDCSRKNEVFKGSSGEVSEVEFRGLCDDDCSMHATQSVNVECLPPVNNQLTDNSELVLTELGTLNSLKRDPEIGLKIELDAIDAIHQRWVRELSRIKQEAIDATKKKWMTLN